MVARRPRTALALLALAIAAAVAGCGGSSASHTTRSSARFPSSFVAVSRSSASPGVTVYSSSSGRPLRRLTDGDRDIDPMLVDNGHEVFYVHVPAKVCPVQLYKIPESGGAKTRLSTAGFPGGPVAVSHDGRMLAYTGTRPGTCQLTKPNDWLVLRDLRTGRVHRIHFLVWGVAWAPGDRTLAIVAPNPRTVAARSE